MWTGGEGSPMKLSAFRHVALLVFVISAWPRCELQAQIDQGALVTRLLGSNPKEKRAAIEQVRGIQPSELSTELRQALITALEQSNGAYADHLQALGRGEPDLLQHGELADLHGDLVEVVARIRDPKAIPALVRGLGTGLLVIRAVTEFGEAAVPHVVQSVLSDLEHTSVVNGGLIVLRFHVERVGESGLADSTRAQIRRAADLRLTGTQGATTLWRAIDLAIALGDQRLIQEVRVLASNTTELRRRGVTDPELILETQRRIADRLAGKPALPRP